MVAQAQAQAHAAAAVQQQQAAAAVAQQQRAAQKQNSAAVLSHLFKLIGELKNEKQKQLEKAQLSKINELTASQLPPGMVMPAFGDSTAAEAELAQVLQQLNISAADAAALGLAPAVSQAALSPGGLGGDFGDMANYLDGMNLDDLNLSTAALNDISAAYGGGGSASAHAGAAGAIAEFDPALMSPAALGRMAEKAADQAFGNGLLSDLLGPGAGGPPELSPDGPPPGLGPSAAVSCLLT